MLLISLHCASLPTKTIVQRKTGSKSTCLSLQDGLWCEILRRRFQSIVHFQYISDKNVWLEVRSDKAWSAFRAQIGEEGLEKGTSHVVSQVQLLPFGSGTSPVADAMQDAFLLSFQYQEQLAVQAGRPTLVDKFISSRAVKLSEGYASDSGHFRNMTPHEWWAQSSEAKQLYQLEGLA